MNKSFILFDKNNNLQKNANVIVMFNFDGKNYLVYSVEENEQNAQIFVSKIILNSEGRYFIDNVMLEEKNKLNNIVYNIVILIPTEAQKGATFEVLSNNLFDKFSVKLSSDVPELGMQEYFRNSSVAITSKLLVDAAFKFYNDNLNDKSNIDVSVSLPTWTVPIEPTTATSMDTNTSVDSQPSVVSNSNISVQEPVIVPNLNLQSVPVNEPVISSVEKSVVSTEVVDSPVASNPINTVVNNGVEPNPQAEKLAIVSDPSLGLGVSQPNVGKIKKAGFANTKYIVIGTICLVLAVAVVVTAYILIKNMQ